ncbi:26S proteasome non-ATPase regulatory subunit 10-like [Dysidea avara]|uniref:26S proteasome non-ATPase regulatory subunit 10-like n=1 Tax=Dysidea avara TaxID=196820 RepID=UPI003324A3F1
MKQASKLRATERWNNIYVTPDLTIKERETNKALKEELKRPKDNGEKNLIIKRGRIYGWTALHLASNSGYLEVVNTLLSSGANILATNDVGDTPLHLAAFHNQYDVCLVLLQDGASVKMKNKFNKTPLDDAKTKGHHEVVQLLESYSQKVSMNHEICPRIQDFKQRL